MLSAERRAWRSSLSPGHRRRRRVCLLLQLLQLLCLQRVCDGLDTDRQLVVAIGSAHHIAQVRRHVATQREPQLEVQRSSWRWQ